MIESQKDMTPEQLEAFNYAMVVARQMTKDILLAGVITLAALIGFDMIICNNFIHDPAGRFFVYFFTVLLIVMDGIKALEEESDRFRAEVNEILKNK